MPVEIEPPSPMPAPPLRKRPTFKPQFAAATAETSTVQLFVDARWN